VAQNARARASGVWLPGRPRPEEEEEGEPEEEEEEPEEELESDEEVTEVDPPATTARPVPLAPISFDLESMLVAVAKQHEQHTAGRIRELEAMLGDRERELHSAMQRARGAAANLVYVQNELNSSNDRLHQVEQQLDSKQTQLVLTQEIGAEVSRQLNAMQQAKEQAKAELGLKVAEVNDLTTCSVCLDNAVDSHVRCTQGHPMHMSCMLQAGTNQTTTCCKGICKAELLLPPGLTPFNCANESLTFSGMIQSLRANELVKSIVQESILSHNPGGDAPLATRVCCGAPLPTGFSNCCSIRCSECDSYLCGVCWEEFVSATGERRSQGMQELAEYGPFDAIHKHVKYCFGRRGLHPSEDDNSFNATSDAKRRVVMRGWGERMLSQYFSKRTAYDAQMQEKMLALLHGLTLEQMMDMVGVLGYPVMTMEQVGGGV
jgi:hypothetical protein